MSAAFKGPFSQISTVRSCYRVMEHIMLLGFCISMRLAPTAYYEEGPHIFEQGEACIYLLMLQGKITYSVVLVFAEKLEQVMLLFVYNIITNKRICSV